MDRFLNTPMDCQWPSARHASARSVSIVAASRQQCCCSSASLFTHSSEPSEGLLTGRVVLSWCRSLCQQMAHDAHPTIEGLSPASRHIRFQKLESTNKAKWVLFAHGCVRPFLLICTQPKPRKDPRILLATRVVRAVKLKLYARRTMRCVTSSMMWCSSS